MMRRTGQTVTEYTVLVGLVTAAAMGMQVYSKRAVQSVIKSAADAMSPYSSVEDPHGELAQLAGIIYETGKRTDDELVPDGDPSIADDGLMPGDVLVSTSSVRSSSTRRLVQTGMAGGSVTRTVVPGQDRSQSVGTLALCGAQPCSGTNTTSYSEVILDRLYQ